MSKKTWKWICRSQGVTKHQKFKIIQDNVDQNLEERTPQPFITLRIGKEELQTYAFIHSGGRWIYHLL